MTRPLSHALPPPAFAWSVVATLLLATPAFAQGTAEQREACTEDAIRLCPDAIPDVDKTTACMKVHEAQLSPRCHRVFSAELETPLPRAEERPRRAARAPRAEEDDIDRPRAYRRDDGYYAPRRIAPGPEEGYYQRRRGAADPDDVDYAPRRVAPDEGYYEPGRVRPRPDEDSYDRPRRVERAEPNPYDDGYGPRRYLYSTPQGTAETPY